MNPARDADSTLTSFQIAAEGIGSFYLSKILNLQKELNSYAAPVQSILERTPSGVKTVVSRTKSQMISGEICLIQALIPITSGDATTVVFKKLKTTRNISRWRSTTMMKIRILTLSRKYSAANADLKKMNIVSITCTNSRPGEKNR